MKTPNLGLLVCLLANLSLSLLHGQDSLPTEPVYTIQNGSKNGAYVSVGDNQLTFTSADGTIVDASEAFTSPNVDWKPTGTIVCSWSPDGRFLAIFIPHPRVTVVTVINLRTNKVYKEDFPEERRYPKWYTESNVLATHDTPQTWEGDSLLIKTEVTFPDKPPRVLPRVLIPTRDFFQILPRETSGETSPKGAVTPPINNPTPQKPQQTSIEWN